MAATDFYALKVQKIERETTDAVSVYLQLTEEIKDIFKFKAGQYLTFKLNKGEEIRRSYSLSSSPDDDLLRVGIKQVPEGIFSTYANVELKEGDQLECMPPMGNFVTDVDAKQARNYIAFAAGSGITPIMSLMKTILSTEANSTFKLVFGNKEFQSIMYREEIEALKNQYLERLQVIHILSREKLESDINNGRIDQEKCEKLFDGLLSLKSIDQAFLCGPEAMILGVRDYLQENGLAKEQVKFELFTTAASQQKNAGAQEKKVDDSNLSDVTIKVDDRTFDIKLGAEGASILDAALMKGADLPYACKGGVCCTCRAKVIEGEVTMDVNYALEEDEVAEGFILTCQAHPKSDKVVVDFDVS